MRKIIPPLTRAFWDFPETLHLIPKEQNRHRVLPRYLASDVADAARYGTVFAAFDHNEVLGAATWLPPHTYPIGTRRQIRQVWRLVPTLPWTIRQAAEAARGHRANRARHKDQAPHYFLRAVGVDPPFQRRELAGLFFNRFSNALTARVWAPSSSRQPSRTFLVRTIGLLRRGRIPTDVDVAHGLGHAAESHSVNLRASQTRRMGALLEALVRSSSRHLRQQ